MTIDMSTGPAQANGTHWGPMDRATVNGRPYSSSLGWGVQRTHCRPQTDMLIPVLQEAERGGESGIQGGASHKKLRSTSTRRETEDEAEDKEAHFSSAVNRPAAHVAVVAERAIKTRRRISAQQQTGQPLM